MEGNEFDDMVRRVSTHSSRRHALRALAGGLLAGFVPAASAAKGKRGKKKGKRGKPCAERCGGQCHPRCPDVMRRNQSTCQCECPAEMTRCGQICVGADRCCPGEKTCGGGCILEQECCPLSEKECPNSVCIPKNACCPIVEAECGAECCILGEECCNGECGVADGAICTKDGFCPTTDGQTWACCGTGDCTDDPCCRVSQGEGCCVTNNDPIETTCCPGGVGQCARGGCCPVGTVWKGDCEACCVNAATGCSSCQGAVPGRG